MTSVEKFSFNIQHFDHDEPVETDKLNNTLSLLVGYQSASFCCQLFKGQYKGMYSRPPMNINPFTMNSIFRVGFKILWLQRQCAAICLQRQLQWNCIKARA